MPVLDLGHGECSSRHAWSNCSKLARQARKVIGQAAGIAAGKAGPSTVSLPMRLNQVELLCCRAESAAGLSTRLEWTQQTCTLQ